MTWNATTGSQGATGPTGATGATGAAGGGVSGLSTGKIPKAASATTLADSLISESGTTVTTSGGLSITGTATDDLGGTSALAVTSPAGTANGAAGISVVGYGSTASLNLSSGAGVQGAPVHSFGGDALGLIALGGYYGTAWLNSALIYAKAVGNWAANNQASRFLIDTTDTASQTALTRLQIDATGTTKLQNGVFALDPTADDLGIAIASLPASPTLGMMSVVKDSLVPVIGSNVAAGGAAKALVWYNGANWTVCGK